MRGAPGAAGAALIESDHERGLRLLGLWPGPFDGVAAARSRAAAAAELVNVQALARTAKRLVARRNHPDLARGRGNAADMSAALAAADWVAATRLESVWPPRSQAVEHDPPRRVGVVEVEVSATRIRIAYRGNV